MTDNEQYLTMDAMRDWLRSRGWSQRAKRPGKGMWSPPKGAGGGFWEDGRISLRNAVDWQLADDERLRKIGAGL